MKIAVIGAGYVGLVTGTCLSEVGNKLTVLDIDQRKIDQLNDGIPPIYEPGLDEMLKRNLEAGRLTFTSDFASGLVDVDIVFITVGTPSGADGGADLRHVLSAARSVGAYMSRRVIVVTKSTGPVGTHAKVKAALAGALSARGKAIPFDVVSNPEFLREGSAIADFTNPDRIVIGSTSPVAVERMRELYQPFLQFAEQLLVCDMPSAELIKYAVNAMLATRISFMNEIANLSESLGADITSVRRGLATDHRIGPHFLNAGCGYGGSCFPKDVRALIRMAVGQGQEMQVVRAVNETNESQKTILFRKLREAFAYRGGIKGTTVAIWGLAFKPDTDDVREAPSLALIADLKAAGVHMQAYDPAAVETAKAVLGDCTTIVFCRSAMDAVTGADALVILTEWAEFNAVELEDLACHLASRVVIDGRNIFDPAKAAAAGLAYSSIGRAETRQALVRIPAGMAGRRDRA